MKALSFEQIEKLAHGVARVEEGDGKISFFRFTKEQQELYKNVCTEILEIHILIQKFMQ